MLVLGEQTFRHGETSDNLLAFHCAQQHVIVTAYESDRDSGVNISRRSDSSMPARIDIVQSADCLLAEMSQQLVILPW